jgi:hypothetical protein|eukprot:COSAG06_NODE_329_length_17412_cov_9.404015_10_plen_88_part_00
MRISWCAAGVPIGFEGPRCEDLRTCFRTLRPNIARWQTGREHIVCTDEEFIHVWKQPEKWEETFLDLVDETAEAGDSSSFRRAVPRL